MLLNRPEAEISEELCEGGGLVVGVEAAGVGEDPGVAAAEGFLLEGDAGVFDAGDDAVRSDADEGDDGGAPAFDFGFEALAAGAKFAVGKFIGAGGGALDDVGDAELEVEKPVAPAAKCCRLVEGSEEISRGPIMVDVSLSISSNRIARIEGRFNFKRSTVARPLAVIPSSSTSSQRKCSSQTSWRGWKIADT